MPAGEQWASWRIPGASARRAPEMRRYAARYGNGCSDKSRQMKKDPPPQFAPDELLSPEQYSELALELLRELAQDDPDVAQQLRDAGLELVH